MIFPLFFYRNINSYSAWKDRRLCRYLRRGRKVGESVIPQIKQANKHPLEVFLQICQEKSGRKTKKKGEKKKRSTFVTPSDGLVNLWQALHVSIWETNYSTIFPCPSDLLTSKYAVRLSHQDEKLGKLYDSFNFYNVNLCFPSTLQRK